jgi:hypothetical protein
LSDIKFTIKNHTGKENELADYLSRPNIKEAKSESTISSYEGKFLLNNFEKKQLDPDNGKRKKWKRKKVSKSKQQKISKSIKKFTRSRNQYTWV